MTERPLVDLAGCEKIAEGMDKRDAELLHGSVCVPFTLGERNEIATTIRALVRAVRGMAKGYAQCAAAMNEPSEVVRPILADPNRILETYGLTDTGSAPQRPETEFFNKPYKMLRAAIAQAGQP